MVFDLEWIYSLPNRLPSLLPESLRLAHVVNVVDTAHTGLTIQSDMVAQTVVCHLAK